MRPSPAQVMLFAVLGACQAPTSDSSAFASGPGVTTASVSSTGETTVADASSGAGGGASSSSSTSGESGVGETAQPVLDLGAMPDLGDGAPVGCKGKIDLLFVISRDPFASQAQLIDAFPKFIATIQSNFDDFDYHIMVVDGDDEWGSEYCNPDCPVVDCKIGDPCCPNDNLQTKIGDPCCDVESYPCGYLDGLPECETMMGAGTVFPAGSGASNKLCPIDGGRRYMVKGQTNLADTFACVAQVGTSGDSYLGDALTAAMKNNLNGKGGCNDGFLRDDALLMVTFLGYGDFGGGGLESEGFSWDWAKVVLDAKHGDPESVVMLTFAYPQKKQYDQIWKLVEMFPFGTVVTPYPADYGPGFEKAAALVATACAGFVVPG